MENFLGFFPSSSTLSASSTLSLNTTNSLGYGEYQGGKANGMLGIMAEMGVPATLNAAQNQSAPETNSLARTKTETEVKLGKIKKGDNKKLRKPRHAFQTRSQVDILDDGYRWRKYGQKAVKNNKFPRSYYRCTHQGCNVKKQVQRLTKDEGIVETTYEGMHSHPIEKSNDNFEYILSQLQIYTTSF